MDQMSFEQAISMQPTWLQVWLYIMVAVHFAAVFFVVKKEAGSYGIRWAAIFILLSFLAAGIFMTWLYDQVGYVRLLGLPHLVFWTPVYFWLLYQYRKGEIGGWFKRFVLVYFFIAGTSLIIDLVDVMRYLLGETKVLI